MSSQRKTPFIGAEQESTKGPMHHESRNTEMASDSEVTEMTAEEREAAALLRIAGWNVDDMGEVTDDEADLIIRAASSELVSADALARVREGVLQRRFGTSAARGPSQSNSKPGDMSSVDSDHEIDIERRHRRAADVSASLEEPTGEGRRPQSRQIDAQATRATSSKAAGTARPSVIQQWKTPGRRLADLAHSLRLDGETLLTLDRGGAQTVPVCLVREAAKTLNLSRAETARCFAPAMGDVPRMAAHGRRNRPRADVQAPREFLEIIESSRLPEHDKRYWRDVVASEATEGNLNSAEREDV